MTKINSRNKGNRNERKAAELIKKWTGKEFARTPSSGGLQWKSTNSKGDIVCTTEGHYFPFCIEVKAHKEINFAELLIAQKKGVKVIEFWEQCLGDSIKAKKAPLLLMRYDRLPTDLFFLVITPRIYNLIPQQDLKNIKIKFIVKTNKHHLLIIPSTEFFNIPYKPLRKLIRKDLKKQYEN